MNKPVNFKIAKLLKERGFTKKTQKAYIHREAEHKSDTYEGILTKDILHCDIPAPTIAEVVMWLYEEHGIWISVFQYKDHAADVNDDYVFRTSHTKLSEFKNPIEAYEKAIEIIL